MSRKHECAECKKPFEFTDEIWSISAVKGYKTREYLCECGNKPFQVVPMKKEKIDIWNKLKEVLK